MAVLSLWQVFCPEKLSLTSSVVVTGFHIWHWWDVIEQGNRRTGESIAGNISLYWAGKAFLSFWYVLWELTLHCAPMCRKMRGMWLRKSLCCHRGVPGSTAWEQAAPKVMFQTSWHAVISRGFPPVVYNTHQFWRTIIPSSPVGPSNL